MRSESNQLARCNIPRGGSNRDGTWHRAQAGNRRRDTHHHGVRGGADGNGESVANQSLRYDSFDTDDTTGSLQATEELLTARYPADALLQGLGTGARPDFGLESDNQDDFAALGVALVIAIVLTIAFLMIQFRSIIQPLLVFLADAIQLFGVFTLLELTDNALSFFVCGRVHRPDRCCR